MGDVVNDVPGVGVLLVSPPGRQGASGSAVASGRVLVYVAEFGRAKLVGTVGNLGLRRFRGVVCVVGHIAGD